jgi:hypothetical protein
VARSNLRVPPHKMDAVNVYLVEEGFLNWSKSGFRRTAVTHRQKALSACARESA